MSCLPWLWTNWLIEYHLLLSGEPHGRHCREMPVRLSTSRAGTQIKPPKSEMNGRVKGIHCSRPPIEQAVYVKPSAQRSTEQTWKHDASWMHACRLHAFGMQKEKETEKNGRESEHTVTVKALDWFDQVQATGGRRGTRPQRCHDNMRAGLASTHSKRSGQ